MESLFVPTLIVVPTEVGDKTQLLALLLTARFRKPWPIIAGIVAAALTNHLAVGAVGVWVASLFPEATLSWILAAFSIAVALWMLAPNRLDDEEPGLKKYGSSLTILIALFLVKTGDKIQVATVTLVTQYPHFWLVVIGTTLSMLIVNVPMVLIDNLVTDKPPPTLIRHLATAAFAVLGLYAAWHAAQLTGWL